MIDLLTEKIVVDAEFTTLNAEPVPPPSSQMVSLPVPVEVPAPTLPEEVTEKYTAPVEDATDKMLLVSSKVSTWNVVVPTEFSTANAARTSEVVFTRMPVVPEIERSQFGVVVPIPTLPPK